jgi:hypothetical protein
VQYWYNFAIFAIIQPVWLTVLFWFLLSLTHSPISDGIGSQVDPFLLGGSVFLTICTSNIIFCEGEGNKNH